MRFDIIKNKDIKNTVFPETLKRIFRKKRNEEAL